MSSDPPHPNETAANETAANETAPDEEDSLSSRILAVLIPATVLGVLAANVYSIHKFTWTVTGFATILLVPGAVAGLTLIATLGALLKDRPQEPDYVDRVVRFPLLNAFGALLLFGCLPFWINTWSSEEVGDLSQALVAQRAAEVHSEDGTTQGTWRTVGTDGYFRYRGVTFKVYRSRGRASSWVGGKVYRGWLGWEYLVLE